MVNANIIYLFNTRLNYINQQGGWYSGRGTLQL